MWAKAEGSNTNEKKLLNLAAQNSLMTSERAVERGI